MASERIGDLSSMPCAGRLMTWSRPISLRLQAVMGRRAVSVRAQAVKTLTKSAVPLEVGALLPALSSFAVLMARRSSFS